MILTVTLNPCIDHAVFVDGLKIGDTNRVKKTETDAGGKGLNLSRVAVEMGGISKATGFLGGGAGAYIRSVLKHQGVEYDFVKIAGETRVNFSVEDGSGNPPTTFNEPGPKITSSDLEELVEKCKELSKGASWVCLSGSAPPDVPREIYRTLGTLFRGAGAKVLVDADGDLLKNAMDLKPDFIKPNAAEAGRLLGKNVGTLDEASEAIAELGKLLNQDAIIVVSRGEMGAILSCREGVFRGVSPKVDAKSTIGSGDSLLGAMLWAIEDGRPLPEAFQWGLAAGAATAMTDGSEIARRAKVEELFKKAKVEPII